MQESALHATHQVLASLLVMYLGVVLLVHCRSVFMLLDPRAAMHTCGRLVVLDCFLGCCVADSGRAVSGNCSGAGVDRHAGIWAATWGPSKPSGPPEPCTTCAPRRS